MTLLERVFSLPPYSVAPWEPYHSDDLERYRIGFKHWLPYRALFLLFLSLPPPLPPEIWCVCLRQAMICLLEERIEAAVLHHRWQLCSADEEKYYLIPIGLSYGTDLDAEELAFLRQRIKTTLYRGRKTFYLAERFFHEDWYRDHVLHQFIEDRYRKNRRDAILDRLFIILWILFIIVDTCHEFFYSSSLASLLLSCGDKREDDLSCVSFRFCLNPLVYIYFPDSV